MSAPAATTTQAHSGRPARRESLGSAVLLLAVVAVAGEAAIFSVYSADGLLRLVLLVLTALGGVLLGGARCRPPSWAIAGAALLVVLALAVAPPLGNVVSDERLLIGVVVVGAASVVPAVLPVVRTAHTGKVAGVALGTATAGYGLVVLGTRPIIDVWALLQGAGRGLAAGRNPYELTFPASPPGQVDHCFTYFPGTALLTGPGVWIGGDARWAELLAVIAAAALVARQVHARGGAALGLAVLVALVPGTIRVVQQSWTEPLLLVLLVAAAVLAGRGRPVWAAVVFGLALATKQHVIVLAPLLLLWRFRVRELAVAAGTAAAVMVPLLVANPSRFIECTVEFFLAAEAPQTSLSLWLHVPVWAQLPLLALGLLAGYLLAWRCCPRTSGGFLVACAAVFLAFGLVNKQTFLNQWWLVASLVVAGLALAGGRRVTVVGATR
ncbi:MAG: glycosyltransferase 87 family protein [Pseudonocardiaceae bacterium]